MSERPVRTLVFETTNAALWAEEAARDAGIPVEVVPAPAAAKAKCDLALITHEERGDALSEVLASQGVPYMVWGGNAPT